MRLLIKPPLAGGLLLMVVAVLALSACGRQDPVSQGRINAFGSTVDLTLIGVDRGRADEITRILAKDMQAMETAWSATGDGPVPRINRMFNESDEPFAAPPSVLPLLRLSQRLSAASDGLFNPAIGHLVRAWGFQGRPADCLRPPPSDLIATAVSGAPSMQDIRIDGIRIASANHLVKLDFRDIQKGLAIDKTIARLQELGVDNASVAIEGNLRAIGSRDGHPWSVPVRGPDGGGILATLKLIGNEAAFTAGNYRRNFTWDGKIYHDIIDPRSGYPAEETASVTVLHADATTADAAATALFVAGPRDWHRVARQMGIRYVMLSDRQGRLHMNPAMQARVKLHGSQREIIVSEPLS
ncbi:MAG: FAD:protein FMN transferase [Gammaproteobacteria bacterium]|nr:FAD:protein FMN transferase [Gammaproteobacteria bacterium]